MQIFKNYKIWLILICVLLIIVTLIFWLKPKSLSENQSDNVSINTVTPLTNSINSQHLNSQNQIFSSKSQQDTQINCQIQVDASNRLIVNEQTKNCFEYFITQFGEKSIDQIKIDFIKYAKATYKEPVLSQLTDLWTRYINYRSKLGDIQAPNMPQEDPKYYRSIFNNMHNLRKQFFSDYEIEGLFGAEDTYNQYTLDRLDILDNKKLSAEEKANQLKKLFDQLPQDWQANLKQLSQLEDLRKLTAEIKAKGGSTEELRNMRMNLVGAEATQRLETLDVQRQDWKQRVNQFLSERDTIIQSSMSDSAKQTAIQKLRKQNFSDPHEQLRVETFETVHDQGGQLPFAE